MTVNDRTEELRTCSCCNTQELVFDEHMNCMCLECDFALVIEVDQ